MKKEKSVEDLVVDLKKYQNKIEKTVNEIEEKLSNGHNTTSGRGWCTQCGEDFDLKEEWKYNTHCGSCGYPIPIDKIVKRISIQESPKEIPKIVHVEEEETPSGLKEFVVLVIIFIILCMVL